MAVFAIAAAIIWLAGSRLERYADTFARRTGLGKAFIGLLLLATATSLPEVGTTVTAMLRGNTSLAVHNLLGGVVMQTAVLAVADGVLRNGALTRVKPRFELLIQGVGLVQILAIALILLALGDRASVALPIGSDGWRLGLTAPLMFGLYVLVSYLTYKSQSRPGWVPARPSNEPGAQPARQPSAEDVSQPSNQQRSLRNLLARFGGWSLLVLAGGWTVASTADVLAQQTGLGASFIGATLVAVATSLPELSTTVSAAKHENSSMAISNIFGSNSFDVMLLGVVALMSGTGGILAGLPPSAIAAAGFGILMTCLYLWGLLERADRVVWRLGWDSVVIVILYLGGTYTLYLLR